MSGWPYSEMEGGDVLEERENREEAAQRILEERERVLSHAPPSILAPREKYARPVHGGYPDLSPEEHAAMLDVHAGDDRWDEADALAYCERVRYVAAGYGWDFYRVLRADMALMHGHRA